MPLLLILSAFGVTVAARDRSALNKTGRIAPARFAIRCH
jgi:hypothetical protein